MIEFNRRETMAKESKKVDSVEEFLKSKGLKPEQIIIGGYDWDGATMNNLKDLLTEYASQQKESVVCTCNGKSIETAKGIICYECEKPK